MAAREQLEGAEFKAVPGTQLVSADYQRGKAASSAPQKLPDQFPNPVLAATDFKMAGGVSPSPTPCGESQTVRVFHSNGGTSRVDYPAASAVKVDDFGGRSYYSTAKHVVADRDFGSYPMLGEFSDPAIKGIITKKGLHTLLGELDKRVDIETADAENTAETKWDAKYILEHFSEIDKDGKGQISRQELTDFYNSHFTSSIETPEGARVPAIVVQKAEGYDAALLATASTPGSPVPLSTEIKLHQPIVAKGFPHAAACGVKTGVITGVGDVVTSSAGTIGGMSGGGLFDPTRTVDGQNPMVAVVDAGSRDPNAPNSSFTSSAVVMQMLAKERAKL